MQRNNNLQLSGKLEFDEISMVPMGGKDVVCVHFFLITDRREFGGHHRCMAYDRPALEILAFWRAFQELKGIREEMLEGLVYGSLRSSEEKSLVVTDRVTFFVSTELREKAVSYLAGMDQKTQPVGRRGQK